MSHFRLAVILTALLAVPCLAHAGDDEAKPTAGWDKGFFIQSPDGKFKLAPRGRIQVRFNLESLAGDPREPEANFELKRLRVGFKGHLFTKQFTYRLEMDFGKGGFSPKYMYLDYAIKPGWLSVRAGHFKRPFSRAQRTGDEKQALVDRSITDKGFRAGYDLGVMLHNGTKSPVEWAFMFSNGGAKSAFHGEVDEEGEVGGKFSNTVDLFQPTTTLRLGVNHGGIKGYDELDLAGGGFRFALAGAAQMSFDIADEMDGWFGAQIDAIVKVKGFSATTAVYLSTAQEGEAWRDQAFDHLGLHFQAAYLIDGKVAPAFRYGRVQSLSGDGEVSQELSAGVHVLFWKRHITWSTDFAALGGTSLAPAETDFRLRSQAQVHF